MKVLVAHNRYRSDVPSGENIVVDTEIEALTAAGLEVVTYLRSSDEIDEMPLVQRLGLPLQPLHSRRGVADVVRLIDRHGPDLVHLHNPYPFISLSVVRAAHSRGLPVVQTVHNHRHSCMRGSYFREGRACYECRGKALPWPAVQHGCYRDSRVQSLPMAAAFLAHRSDQRAVDRYIALTEPIAQSLRESGLVSPGQVSVRPSSVPDPGGATPPGSGLLFVGRLTSEKGVHLILDAWQRSGRAFGTLTFVGDGNARAEVEKVAADPTSGVVFLGPQDRRAVDARLRASAAVVVPSASPEALPLVVLEAFANGRPVLATTAGGLTAAVDARVGWLCQPDPEAMARELRTAATADLAELGGAARRRYETTYSPTVVMQAQMSIYRSVIAAAAN